MNLKCLFGAHVWDGCKCNPCGKTRDEAHSWDGCKCLKCGHTRDEGHNWSKDCENCSECRKVSAECPCMGWLQMFPVREDEA